MDDPRHVEQPPAAAPLPPPSRHHDEAHEEVDGTLLPQWSLDSETALYEALLAWVTRHSGEDRLWGHVTDSDEHGPECRLAAPEDIAELLRLSRGRCAHCGIYLLPRQPGSDRENLAHLYQAGYRGDSSESCLRDAGLDGYAYGRTPDAAGVEPPRVSVPCACPGEDKWDGPGHCERCVPDHLAQHCNSAASGVWSLRKEARVERGFHPWMAEAWEPALPMRVERRDRGLCATAANVAAVCCDVCYELSGAAGEDTLLRLGDAYRLEGAHAQDDEKQQQQQQAARAGGSWVSRREHKSRRGSASATASSPLLQGASFALLQRLLSLAGAEGSWLDLGWRTLPNATELGQLKGASLSPEHAHDISGRWASQSGLPCVLGSTVDNYYRGWGSSRQEGRRGPGDDVVDELRAGADSDGEAGDGLGQEDPEQDEDAAAPARYALPLPLDPRLQATRPPCALAWSPCVMSVSSQTYVQQTPIQSLLMRSLARVHRDEWRMWLAPKLVRVGSRAMRETVERVQLLSGATAGAANKETELRRALQARPERQVGERMLLFVRERAVLALQDRVKRSRRLEAECKLLALRMSTLGVSSVPDLHALAGVLMPPARGPNDDDSKRPERKSGRHQPPPQPEAPVDPAGLPSLQISARNLTRSVAAVIRALPAALEASLGGGGDAHRPPSAEAVARLQTRLLDEFGKPQDLSSLRRSGHVAEPAPAAGDSKGGGAAAAKKKGGAKGGNGSKAGDTRFARRFFAFYRTDPPGRAAATTAAPSAAADATAARWRDWQDTGRDRGCGLCRAVKGLRIVQSDDDFASPLALCFQMKSLDDYSAARRDGLDVSHVLDVVCQPCRNLWRDVCLCDPEALRFYSALLFDRKARGLVLRRARQPDPGGSSGQRDPLASLESLAAQRVAGVVKTQLLDSLDQLSAEQQGFQADGDEGEADEDGGADDKRKKKRKRRSTTTAAAAARASAAAVDDQRAAAWLRAQEHRAGVLSRRPGETKWAWDVWDVPMVRGHLMLELDVWEPFADSPPEDAASAKRTWFVPRLCAVLLGGCRPSAFLDWCRAALVPYVAGADPRWTTTAVQLTQPNDNERGRARLLCEQYARIAADRATVEADYRALERTAQRACLRLGALRVCAARDIQAHLERESEAAAALQRKQRLQLQQREMVTARRAPAPPPPPEPKKRKKRSDKSDPESGEKKARKKRKKEDAPAEPAPVPPATPAEVLAREHRNQPATQRGGAPEIVVTAAGQPQASPSPVVPAGPPPAAPQTSTAGAVPLETGSRDMAVPHRPASSQATASSSTSSSSLSGQPATQTPLPSPADAVTKTRKRAAPKRGVQALLKALPALLEASGLGPVTEGAAGTEGVESKTVPPTTTATWARGITEGLSKVWSGRAPSSGAYWVWAVRAPDGCAHRPGQQLLLKDSVSRAIMSIDGWKSSRDPERADAILEAALKYDESRSAAVAAAAAGGRSASRVRAKPALRYVADVPTKSRVRLSQACVDRLLAWNEAPPLQPSPEDEGSANPDHALLEQYNVAVHPGPAPCPGDALLRRFMRDVADDRNEDFAAVQNELAELTSVASRKKQRAPRKSK